MKCKLYENEFGHSKNLSPEAAAAHINAGGLPHHAPLPAGTIIDHPDCWILVKNGQAEPADDECAKKVNMSPAELAEARAAYKQISMGRATGIKKHDAPAPAHEQASLADGMPAAHA